MGDHPDAHAEEVEDRAHPLRVAPGEVVVDGDDVDAPAGQRVEDRGQRRDEGLALAGPHLGDLALVEDRAADELDVEVAHPERPLHGLAGHREDLGQDLVEGVLERARSRACGAPCVSSRRRSRSGWWSSSSDGSSGSAASRISSRISAKRPRISSSDRASISASRSLASSTNGWMRRARGRSSRRTGKGIAWPVKYRRRSGPGGARGERGQPVGGPNSRSRCRSRPQQHEREAPRTSQNSTERNREVGFISGFWSPAGVRPERRAPARRPELVAPVGVGDGARLEAALAVGSVELKAHRSPAGPRRPVGRRDRSPSRPAVARSTSPRAVLPEEHLLGERTSLENSAPTDSPRWMRLIASPISGATDRVVIGIRLRSWERDRNR